MVDPSMKWISTMQTLEKVMAMLIHTAFMFSGWCIALDEIFSDPNKYNFIPVG